MAQLSQTQLDTLRAQYAKINGIDPASPTYKQLIDKLNNYPINILRQLADARIKFVSGLAANRVRSQSTKEGASPSSVHSEILSSLASEIIKLPKLTSEQQYKKAARGLLISKPVVPAAQIDQMVNRFIKAYPYTKYNNARRVASQQEQQNMTTQFESTKLVSTQANGKKTAKIYRDSETDEYIVKFYVDGKYQKDADYFTDDKQDAMDTAKAEVKRANEALIREAEDDEFDQDEKNPRDIEKDTPSELDLDWISKFDLSEIKEAIQKIIDHLSETEDEEQIDLLRNDIRILDNLHAALSKKDSEGVDKHWKIAKSEGSHEHLHPEFTKRLDDATSTVSVKESADATTNTFANKAKWNQAAKKYRVKETGKTLTAFCKETGKMMGRFANDKGWLETC